MWLKEILPPPQPVRPLKNFTKPSFFYDRSNNFDTCCLILAGYKNFLWDIVFQRLETFVPDNIDVCIVSSGLFSEQLLDICKKNNWSYISIKRNSVTLALNTAIRQFSYAQYIYKIDEDIFLTRNFFNKLFDCLKYCQKGEYIPAFIAPLIPINGYGYIRILKKISLENEYISQFERPKYGILDGMINTNPNVAKFFWGENNYIPSIDFMDTLFASQETSYSVCPVRFSIGAILFERKTWQEMGYFPVNKNNGMGDDEVKICSLAMTISHAIIVSENTVVGHLSFGEQNESMKEYFLSHPDIFRIIIEEK
jgi:hypothetical protein